MRLPARLADTRIVHFNLTLYRFGIANDYYVIDRGSVRGVDDLLVRVHSACSFATVFNSQRCDCEAQLAEAMLRIGRSRGLIIYAWPHEGRGVGFWDHVRVYMEQDGGEDTVSAYEKLGLPIDSRSYTEAAEILKDYELRRVRLLTNNPSKISGLEKCGIAVTRVPLLTATSRYNRAQVVVKIEKLGHFLLSLTGALALLSSLG